RLYGVWAASPRLVTGPHRTAVTDIGAAVRHGIAVEQLAPGTGHGDAHAIVGTWNRREVGDDRDAVVRVARPTQKGEDTAVSVVALQPFEARPVEIHLMQRRL